ncbi:hypothetical protein [Capnocytophaga catalasegens]|uniref:DUF4258 domain-containing protein n=1 Tax=Capnocytophaga catalasegens TaxID=1004260 RepID=A0AAV5AUI4_9FLAO|nr:hypothetical protein [Capnocytophaga catalasegens]GIZ16121.1 hypothetical protein RCZ03_21210 [Capnocytophaga catalasegens]GJM50936.1 hypothetical protein RCZ15_19090 [Capnocytophaga catalasegens]GJM53780.1 hypothetical protein RCZ16_20960 [Capnocytophaga catalasegens]
MDIVRRLGIFFIGLSIGIVILAFFFKGKGVEICYLPNCRVLKDIRNKTIFIDQSVEKQKFTLDVLKPIFWEGNVVFSQSDTRSTPCKTYLIEGLTTNNEMVKIKVENCPTKATIISVENF